MYIRYPTVAATTPSFPFLAPNGSVAAPSYSFSSSTNTGLYLDSVGVLGVAAGGVEVARFLATSFQVPLTSNQLKLGANGASTFISAAANSADRTVSIPALSANDTFAFLGVNNTFTGTQMLLQNTNGGGSVSFQSINLSNTASSHSLFKAYVGGTSAGNAYIEFSRADTAFWSLGLNPSVSDQFEIANASNIGSSPKFILDTAGRFALSSSINTASIIDIGGTNSLSGTTQGALRLESFVANSSATVAANGISIGVGSADSSFTIPIIAHFQSVGKVKGASSTITRAIGYYAKTPMTTVGATHSAEFANNASFSGDYFINQSGTLTSNFSGNVIMQSALRHTGTTVGFYGATAVVQTAPYTVSNASPSRTLNVSTVTLTQLANNVAQIIADLQALGLVG